MISVIKNGDTNLKGTKVTPQVLQQLTSFPGLKSDSVKCYGSMSFSYNANFIPIHHQLGTEIAIKTLFWTWVNENEYILVITIVTNKILKTSFQT